MVSVLPIVRDPSLLAQLTPQIARTIFDEFGLIHKQTCRGLMIATALSVTSILSYYPIYCAVSSGLDYDPNKPPGGDFNFPGKFIHNVSGLISHVIPLSICTILFLMNAYYINEHLNNMQFQTMYLPKLEEIAKKIKV